MCQNSLPSGGVGHSEPRFQGEGVVPGEYFLVSTKLDTFCYLTAQTAPCYVSSFWHNTGVWQTDRQMDGRNCRRYYSACNASIAAASIAACCINVPQIFQNSNSIKSIWRHTNVAAFPLNHSSQLSNGTPSNVSGNRSSWKSLYDWTALQNNHLSSENTNAQVKNNHKLTKTHLNNTSTATAVKNDEEEDGI